MIHPTRRHRRWTVEADDTLRRMIGEGEYLPAIAGALGRTQEACRTRANLLKLSVRSSAGPRRVGIHREP